MTFAVFLSKLFSKRPPNTRTRFITCAGKEAESQEATLGCVSEREVRESCLQNVYFNVCVGEGTGCPQKLEASLWLDIPIGHLSGEEGMEGGEKKAILSDKKRGCLALSVKPWLCLCSDMVRKWPGLAWKLTVLEDLRAGILCLVGAQHGPALNARPLLF